MTRNGAGVITVFGGGVVNLPVGQAEGDEDGDGFPDLAAAVCRELSEETGLRIEPDVVRPVTTYLLNERGPDLDGSGRGRGQLVATVAFSITLEQSFDDLVRLRVEASPSKGRYENSGLVPVDIPAVRPGDDPTVAATRFARSIHDLSGELDQRGFVAALYTASEIYSPEVALASFAQVWPQGWWRGSWAPGLEPSGTHPDRLAAQLVDLVDSGTYAELESAASTLGLAALPQP